MFHARLHFSQMSRTVNISELHNLYLMAFPSFPTWRCFRLFSTPFGSAIALWDGLGPLQALLCDQKDLRDFVEVFEQWEIPLAKAPIQRIHNGFTRNSRFLWGKHGDITRKY